jgi:tRNA(fMet)-specific endonuclease VapC
MTWLLDTNTCVDYLRRPDGRVGRRLTQAHLADIAVCAVVKAELYFGALNSGEPVWAWRQVHEFLGPLRSYPFDDRAAEAYARLRIELARKGTLIGPHDLLIASIALANGLVLVTHNVREYQRVAGLRLEDWQAAP